MEDLQARVAALERENRELREQNQKFSSTQKLTPQLPGEGKRKSSIYFDGYKTRVDHTDGDGGKQDESQNDQLPPTDEIIRVRPSWGRVSSISCIDMDMDMDTDESEKDLDAYIEGQFEADDGSSNSGMPCIEEQQDCAPEEKVRYGHRKSGKNRPINRLCASDHIMIPIRDDLDPVVSSYLDKIGASTGSGTASNIDEDAFRRSSLLGNRRWSNLTRSSDGNKVYNFRGDGIGFTLGQKKKNRYSQKVEEILSKTVQNDSIQSDEGAPHQRPLMVKFKTDAKLVDDKGTTPKRNRQSCPVVPMVSRDVEIFTKLNRTIYMCKMMSQRTNQPDQQLIASQQRSSFQQFLLLSVDHQTSSCKIHDSLASTGANYLDPFILKSAECVDKYPLRRISEDNFHPEELSSFCCGDGVKLRLVPKLAEAGAARLGWMGPSANEYKLLVFTDGNGMATHGVAITISAKISANQLGPGGLVSNLQAQRAKRQAARKVSKWWRLCLAAKKDDEASLNSMHSIPKVSFMRTISSSGFSSDTVSLNSGTRRKRKTGLPRSSLIHSSLKTSAVRIGMIKKKISSKQKSSKKKDKSPNIPGENSKGCDESQNCGHVDDLKRTPLSERAKKLGKESFDMMELVATMGETLIVDKCYILIGGEESEQFLQLRSLGALVDLERENLEQDSQMGTTRHEYLNIIQRSMCLSPSQSAVRLPKNDLDILSQPPPTFEIDLPSLNGVNGVEKLSVPLPLATPRNWGVAAILHHLTVSDLLCVLHLLLIERSILVIGPNSDIVTSCTCALMDLIRPFQWASNFMPLLPEEMLDFVNSPVPFVIGMVSRSINHSNKITEDCRVKEAMEEGLSVINLATGSVHLTTEVGIKSMVQNCPAPSKLSCYKRRLEELRFNGASLSSFSSFLNQGLSRREVVTLNALNKLIRVHVESFAGDVTERWSEYGSYTEGMFDFYPSLFIEPLRIQTESQLQLQEMMSHSQLFIEFVDQTQKASATKLGISEGEVGTFIAAWVYQKMQEQKQKMTTVKN